MAGSRRTRYSRRRRGGRYLWIAASVTPVTITTSQVVVTQLTPPAVIDDTVLVGCIVTRVLGQLTLRASASDADATLISSVYTQTREAFASSVAPNPEVDIYNFMWTNSTITRLGDQATNTQQTLNIPFDIRVRRKLRQNDTLMFQRFNSGSVSLVAGFFSRVLLYIP